MYFSKTGTLSIKGYNAVKIKRFKARFCDIGYQKLEVAEFFETYGFCGTVDHCEPFVDFGNYFGL